MKLLVLEDEGFRIKFFIERFCRHELKITDNSVDAICYLKETSFDYLFLDNDLGKGNGEGVDVAKFLKENSKNPNNNAIIVVHSWNVVASAKIKTYLPKSIIAPFNTVDFRNLRLDI
jgi:hypothetical protein